MEVCTIGFTGKSAQNFFEALAGAGVRRLIDVRLRNTSQLAAFTKRYDLEFFADQLIGASYVHEPLLAPSSELLDSYKKKRITWQEYESGFLFLMENRHVESVLSPSFFEPRSALLCSEPSPAKCHRRLVLDYLNRRWGAIEAHHL